MRSSSSFGICFWLSELSGFSLIFRMRRVASCNVPKLWSKRVCSAVGYTKYAVPNCFMYRSLWKSRVSMISVSSFVNVTSPDTATLKVLWGSRSFLSASPIRRSFTTPLEVMLPLDFSICYPSLYTA